MTHAMHNFYPAGADLKAVLSEAQLLAVHARLDSDAAVRPAEQPHRQHPGTEDQGAGKQSERGTSSQRQQQQQQQQQRQTLQQHEAPLVLTGSHLQQALHSVRPSAHVGSAQQLQQQEQHAGGSSKRATLA